VNTYYVDMTIGEPPHLTDWGTDIKDAPDLRVIVAPHLRTVTGFVKAETPIQARAILYSWIAANLAAVLGWGWEA
jgi:hypothetical protein